ncbi:Elicitin-like protein [Phytophthora cinnamomi]|uniref:Elicitin-like protein n=1 Tax=Phytophthora cinnamomi TaxID=4785 RepID=UPI003559A7D6|nr:Elicitin-like protein [Phytophthora cinnamomi]
MQFGAAFLLLVTIYGAAAEDACPPNEVMKFAELYANPHLHPCQKASAGFSLVPPLGYPTEPQVKAMCASDACRALIKGILDLKPSDCYLPFSGGRVNAYKMACSFQDACDAHMDKDHESQTYQPTLKPEDKYHATPKPTEDNKHYPTPKPTDHKYMPTPKPMEDDKQYPTPKPSDDKHYPNPNPTDKDHYETPKPTEDNKHYPTPKPTDHKYMPTPKPMEDDKQYPTPKPSDDKHYPTPKPNDDKHYPTPKTTEENYHPPPKPTDDKYHPTPKPIDDGKYHDKPEEPKIVKVDNVNKFSQTTQSVGKEADKDAEILKPPMNGTAFELFPMPNTTYKATHAPKTE